MSSACARLPQAVVQTAQQPGVVGEQRLGTQAVNGRGADMDEAVQQSHQ
jgi:hypothetical protein